RAHQSIPSTTEQAASTPGKRLHLQQEQRLMRADLTPPSIAHLEDPSLQNLVAGARAGLSGWPRPADAPKAFVARASARISFVGAAALLVVFHWWIAVIVLIVGLVLQGQVVKSLVAAV